MRRSAFTLIELFVAMIIILILGGAMTLSPNLMRQTAKREANRIVTQLYRFVEKAEHNGKGFRVDFDGSIQSGKIKCLWSDSDASWLNPDFYLEISKGCTIENLNKQTRDAANLRYSIKSNRFLAPGMTLEVIGTDGSRHYIIIYSTGGRIRTSTKSAREEREKEDHKKIEHS